jgi:hypothetical protein
MGTMCRRQDKDKTPEENGWNVPMNPTTNDVGLGSHISPVTGFMSY